MKRAVVGSLMLVLAVAACTEEVIFVDDGGGGGVPAAPRAVAASYYAGAVTVTWELAPAWVDEPFRVYSKRVSDAEYFFIAEVTSCQAGVCSYRDTNVSAGVTYQYFVSAVDPYSGIETESSAVEVFVPLATPPPVPDLPYAIGLDNAVYITWGDAARAAADFSHYKVYQDLAGSSFLLGETDSEGFLDLLAANGDTYGYFVTSVDEFGHESGGSVVAEATPRPDYHGEVVWDHSADPAASGFRFAEDESTFPILSGNDPDIHFRLEVDASGWWLVAGTGTTFHRLGYATTALKCGVGADLDCVDISVAPASDYSADDLPVVAQESYVLRVVGDDAQIHYGVIRVEMVGYDQDGDAIMIFDWAYQLQAGNPELVTRSGG